MSRTARWIVAAMVVGVGAVVGAGLALDAGLRRHRSLVGSEADARVLDGLASVAALALAALGFALLTGWARAGYVLFFGRPRS